MQTKKSWNYLEFIKYVLPSIIGMVFISLYTIIDGLFIARYVGTNALAAINIVYPIYNIAFGISIMLAAGSSALISIALGKKEYHKVNNYFSLISIVIIVLGISISIFGYSNLSNLLNLLGSTKKLIKYSHDYASIILMLIPFLCIKTCYEYFLRVDESEGLSMIAIITGGIINIVLDYILIVEFNLGIKGAGYATAIGIFISTLICIYHFIFKSKHLNYIRPEFDKNFIINSLINGSSEMIIELSGAITTIIFNITIVKYAGERGIAAISTLLYIFFIFISISLGLTIGIQPLISYNYGAKNYKIIKNIIKKAFIILITISVTTFIIAHFYGGYSIKLFLKNDFKTFNLTLRGLKIFSIALLFCSINILGSTYFTALNKGKKSAIISLSRSIIFLVPSIFLLPIFFKINGFWMSIPLAELITLFITIYFFRQDSILNLTSK